MIFFNNIYSHEIPDTTILILVDGGTIKLNNISKPNLGGYTGRQSEQAKVFWS